MVLLDSNNEIIYICSPYVTNVGELLQYDLRLSAIPIHDNTRDLVLLNQQRLSDVETKWAFFGLKTKLHLSMAHMTNAGSQKIF